MTAQDIIEKLQLQPHPKEGGFFRETYRSNESGGRKERCASTAIYYLLTPTTVSALHRLATDEVFHFYLGDPVRMLQLDPGGKGRTIVLGNDLSAGQHPQLVVPAGIWQGSLLEPGGKFALLGCTVAPGFEYYDYEHASREDLTKEFPDWYELIERLTPVD